MKNIFKIYKDDINGIFRNYALLIVIVGLCILPSLYAWFNIKASWDPYGNTGNISVAVVNKDLGSKVFDKEVNIGNEVIDKLKDNKNLGWKFVDEKTALNGVENGTYYASLEIPENFSKDLTSLLSSEVKKGIITYTVNEKINAIAPKITDKGASTIQLEVNQTVVKTVSETIFEIFNEVGIELEKELPKLTQVENSLVEVQGKFSDIENTINLAYDATSKIGNIVKELQGDMPLIKETISNSKNLSNDVKTFIEDTKGSINGISPIIKTDLGIVADLSASASDTIQNIIDVINKGYDNAPEIIDSLNNKLSNLSNTSKTLSSFLKKLHKFAPGNPLKDVISQLDSINSKINTAITDLETIKNQVASGQKPSLDKLNNMLTLSNDVNTIASNLLYNFDSKISGPINKIFEESIVVANNIIDVLDKASASLPEIEDILNTSLAFSKGAKDSVDFIKEKIPLAKSMVNDLVDAISKINNSKEIEEIIALLKNDIISRSEFLKQPVDLVTKKLYPIANYGSAMTPFYTVLSLWVGVLLLLSLLTTEIHGPFKPYEVYFGRGLTFLTLAIIQALICSIGDIYVLGVSTVEPTLFVLLSVFTSCVFTFIVYSLVSVFGNVGKAIGVVLLVIQVAASGGTFPIEVTPPFFRMVNPFLPFTYAISSLREAVGGVYMNNLSRDIVVLSIFLVASICINVLLKGPINRVSEKFRHKFNDSNLTGH